MKHVLLKSIIILTSSITTYTMDPDRILIKLDDQSLHSLSKNIADKSNTIHTKCLWKNRLSINPNKPIILHDISSTELALFTAATTYSRKNFITDFFEKLSSKKQKRLTSIAGETHLNSPEITLLLLEQLPTDILNIIENSFEKSKNKIAHYLQCTMIKKNMNEYPTIKKDNRYSFQNDTTIYLQNGSINYIPKFFSSINTFCTENRVYKASPLTKKATILATNKNNNEKCSFYPCQKFIHYAGKKINNCTYQITSSTLTHDETATDDSLYIWRIKTNPQTFEYYKTSIRKSKKFIWCNDGTFIATSKNNGNYTLEILTLDRLSENIITKQESIPLDHICTAITSSNNSTTFAITLYNHITDTSTLAIYNFSGTIQSTFSFPGKCDNLSFNHDDSRLIGAVILENEYSKIFVFDTTNLTNITEIDPDRTFVSNLNISFVQYSPYTKNIAVAHIQSGNLLLIKEKMNRTIQISYLMNEKYNNHYSADYPICSLFSPDGNFIFHSTNYLQMDRQDMALLPLLIPSYSREEKLMIWDIETKELIAQQKSNEPIIAQQPQIILNADEGRLITNHNDNSWWMHKLYSKNEYVTISWIKNNSNIFELYALRRLYRAHKNKEDLSLENNPALCDILDSIPSSPHTIKQCILNYLIHKQDTGLWAKAVELVQNFWK